MRGFILSIVAVLIATVSTADEPVAVRAVEHPEYSRLVLPIPTGADWSLSQDGSRAVLRLSGPVPPLDVSGVFNRMPRTRILSVSARAVPGGATMDMTLACACEVAPSEIGSGFLAVDVRRADAEGGAGSARLRPGRISQLSPGDSVPLEKLVEAIDTPKPPVSPPAEKTVSPGPAPDAVLQAREQLLAQLERAAEEGLLTLAPEVLTETPPQITSPETADTGAPRIPAEATLPAFVAELAPDLGAHLSVRDPALESRPEPQVADVAIRCVNDNALNIASWEQPGPFVSALGAYRRRLVDASGAIQDEVIEDLARLYISVGFGREAGALLSRIRPTSDTAGILADMARILDGGAPNGPIRDSAECSGRVDLWRYAAGLPVGAIGSEGNDLLSSLEELPGVPRKILAATVVRQALAQNRPDLARDVLELLDRTPESGGPAEATVRAAVALDAGDAEKALAVIAPYLDGVPTPAPDLLLVQAQAMLSTGDPVPEAILSAMDQAIAVMPDQTGLARQMRLARISAEAARGRPVEALRALRQIGVGDPASQEVGLKILENLSDDARDDMAGIVSALENRDLLNGHAAEKVRLAYADTLTKGGLPNAVETLLLAKNGIPDAETSLAIARARMRTSDPTGALALLSEVSGAEAATIRAQARRWLGHGPDVSIDRASSGNIAGHLPLDRLETGHGAEGPYAILSAFIGGDRSTYGPVDLERPTLEQAEAVLSDVTEIRGAVLDISQPRPLEPTRDGRP